MPADDYALHNRKRGVDEVLPSAEEEEVVSNMPATAADAAATVSSANHSPRMVRCWPGKAASCSSCWKANVMCRSHSSRCACHELRSLLLRLNTCVVLKFIVAMGVRLLRS